MMARPMHRALPGRIPIVAIVLVASSCGLTRYQPAPIDIEQVAQDLLAKKLDLLGRLPGVRLDLATIEALAIERDPDVRSARADLVAAQALDDVRARLAEPSLSVGINAAVGAGVDRRPVAPALGLNVPLPLTRRRQRENTRDHAAVLLVEARLEQTVRRAVLDARALYAEAALADERLSARDEMATTMQALALTAESLARSGAASGLDLALLRLEAAAADQARFDAELARDEAVAGLAESLTLEAAHFEGTSFTPVRLPSDAIDAAALAEQLKVARTDLVVALREHELAEAELALEVSRQIQDVSLGGSLAPQPAETFTLLGLALTGALPIFSRNAQAIAVAAAERERTRARYLLVQDRADAALAAAVAAWTRAGARVEFIEEHTLPAADAVVEAADRGVRAGTAQALSLLGATRTRLEVRFQELLARQMLLRAWLRLERAVEAPLLPGGAEDASEWRDRARADSRDPMDDINGASGR